jgi:hypothetical protein
MRDIENVEYIHMSSLCTYDLLSEWVVVDKPLNEQFFSYIMARTSYIRRDDDYVRFVLDQHD